MKSSFWQKVIWLLLVISNISCSQNKAGQTVEDNTAPTLLPSGAVAHHSMPIQITLDQEVLTIPFHWVSTNDFSQPLIVAIHGTPGSWSTWKAFINKTHITKHFTVLSIDRPGWGETQTQDKRVIPTFKEQSRIIGTWLEYIKDQTQQPLILLGHSWGGPVAAQLMIDYPTLIDGAVMVAGPFSPSLSEPRWYHKWANTKVIGWLIGSALRRSNQEMLPLAKELAIMQNSLASIDAPIVIIQGDRDKLVPKGNADYLKEKLINSPVKLIRYPQLGHFIPFRQPELMAAGIQHVYENISDSPLTYLTP